jgi:hypothetical protein
MKKMKLAFTAVALVTVVGGALAFRTVNAGTIYCAAPATTVNASATCNTQSGLTRVAFIPAGLSSGDTKTPCADAGLPSTDIPYVTAASSCTTLPVAEFYDEVNP